MGGFSNKAQFRIENNTESFDWRGDKRRAMLSKLRKISIRGEIKRKMSVSAFLC